jgi:uncharacterized protein
MSEQSQSFEPQSARALPGRRRFGLWLGSCLLLAALVPPVAAQAQSRVLDAPRAAGLVGERFDGFAVARGAVPPDVAALVESVNAERRAIYTQRASTQGVPVQEVGKVYALEILKSAPAGTWFLGENGQWTRR